MAEIKAESSPGLAQEAEVFIHSVARHHADSHSGAGLFEFNLRLHSSRQHVDIREKGTSRILLTASAPLHLGIV